MTRHLRGDDPLNYLYRMLTDPQREAMNLHLTRCPECRARLSAHEMLYRRIHARVVAVRLVHRPPPQMTFAAIAPRLRPQFANR